MKFLFASKQEPVAPLVDPLALNAAHYEAIGGSQILIAYDREGRIIKLNERAAAVFGHTRESLVGMSYSELLMDQQSSANDAKAQWERVLRGSTRGGRVARRHRDGHEIWTWINYCPLDGPEGGVLELSADISEQVRREEERIGSSMAIISFTTAGVITRANDTFLGALGYRLEEIVGQHHRMFCRQELAASAEYVTFWTALREGRAQIGDFERLRKDGSPIWIRATYAPIVDDGGEVVGVTKMAVDITEERASQARLATVAGEVAEGLVGLEAASDEISNVSREGSERSRNLQGEVEQLVATFETLGRAGKEIDEIVALIRGLADRSNLLALNATIESARAGEAGKGFAVVAGEVKELSNQTKDATSTISERVLGIQSAVQETGSLVTSLQEGLACQSEGSQSIASAILEQQTIVSQLGAASRELRK